MSRKIFLEKLDMLVKSGLLTKYEFTAPRANQDEGYEHLILAFSDGTILEVKSAMYPTGFDTYLKVE